MTTSSTIYKKITAGILMPVFLFIAQAGIFEAHPQDQVNIIFALDGQTNAADFFQRYSLEGKQIFSQSDDSNLANIFSSTVTNEVFEKISRDENIRYAELDSGLAATRVETDDPFFTTDRSDADAQWYLPRTRVPNAWDYGQGSDSIIIAVVDTGIHAGHVELRDGRIIAGFDAINDRTISADSNSDDNGHGTAVAGIIGAISDNDRGIAGINWNVKIMPVKVLESDGTGLVSAVSAGITWAADHGANIINLSLGGGGFRSNQTLNNAITYAYNKGALIVAAAGNDLATDGRSLDSSPVYPVCADNGINMVLGVAATDINDQKAQFSNYGKNCIDVSAPGKRILTTAYLPSDPSNTVLIYGSGTSLAAPIVSGIAALIKASNLNLSNVEIRNFIIQTADDIDDNNLNTCGGVSCEGLLGSGRVNAYDYFVPKPLDSGSLVRDPESSDIYLIERDVKRLVSPFVFIQRGYNQSEVVIGSFGQLDQYSLGPVLPPLPDTLIKSDTEPVVYVMDGEKKRPLTYLVFQSHKFSFSKVVSLPDEEVKNYRTGEWYPPAEGTLILVSGNPLVYAMENEVRRPVTFFTFQNRGYSFAAIMNASPEEFTRIPAPADNYWLPPLNGTLVKSDTDPTIYLIESGKRRALSYNAFIAREFSFENVASITQDEIDVIAPGSPIIK